MRREFLSSEQQKKGIHFDPRTKLLLILIISVFVLGGAGGNAMYFLRPVLSLVPFAMLISVGRGFHAALYIIAYTVCYVAQLILLPILTGFTNFLVLILAGTFCRFLPGFIIAYFVVTTTTVSEFMAGMERMHMPSKITIPLSVVFRFAPTVLEEAASISDAMKMRGIRFGGKKSSKILEYRLIPMITCSVKIGEELSAAALTRGLGAPLKRTNICEMGFHFPDVIIFILCGVTVAWVIFSAFSI